MFPTYRLVEKTTTQKRRAEGNQEKRQEEEICVAASTALQSCRQGATLVRLRQEYGQDNYGVENHLLPPRPKMSCAAPLSAPSLAGSSPSTFKVIVASPLPIVAVTFLASELGRAIIKERTSKHVH